MRARLWLRRRLFWLLCNCRLLSSRRWLFLLLRNWWILRLWGSRRLSLRLGLGFWLWLLKLRLLL